MFTPYIAAYLPENKDHCAPQLPLDNTVTLCCIPGPYLHGASVQQSLRMPYSQQQKLNVFERAEDTAEHRLHLKADEQTSYHSSSRRQRKLSLLANCFSDATPTLAGMEKGKRLINAVEHAQLDIDYDEKAAALDTSCRGDEVETRLQSAPFAKRKGLVFF